MELKLVDISPESTVEALLKYVANKVINNDLSPMALKFIEEVRDPKEAVSAESIYWLMDTDDGGTFRSTVAYMPDKIFDIPTEPKPKNIAPGQYWLMEKGEIILVLKKGEGVAWIVNTLGRLGSALRKTAVGEQHFERQLNAKEAKELAMQTVERMVNSLLQF